jgi:1-deoxy-D-xylulose-5-phosphate synthase
VFDPINGPPKSVPTGYTEAFADTIIKLAEQDSRIVAITAAMPGPTGLIQFQEHFPDRFFDVGIAEQHAVTAAAGMAMGGMRPVVALYSTFLNRAWDQIVYDVAMHRLPVIFCLDRAGITGDDGPSHHGVYDMALLSKVPGMRVLAPSSTQDLQQMLSDAISLADTGPVAIRYPKGLARNVDENDIGSGLQARKLVDGATKRVCILAIGKLVGAALEAAETLKASNVDVTVWDVRSCAPLDPAMIADAMQHDVVITAEDGIRDGGIGMTIENTINDTIQTSTGHKRPIVQVLGVPTTFVPTAKPQVILQQMGLDSQGIISTVKDLVDSQ